MSPASDSSAEPSASAAPPGRPAEPALPLPSQEARYLRVLALSAAFGALVLAGVVLHELASVFRPLAVSLFLCYLIWPMVDALRRRGVPRPLGYLFSSTLLFGLLYAVGQLVALNAEGFAANLPLYRANLSGFLSQVNHWLIELHLLSPETPISLKTLDAWMPRDLLAEALGGGTQFFFSFMGTLLVIVFFMLFIILETQYLPERIRRAYGEERADAIIGTWREINGGIKRYLVVKVVLSLATGVLATGVMALFGVDFYYLWGVLAFLLNFIPYLGSILATFIPGMVALVQFASPGTAFWLMVALTVVQLGIGNIIEPQLHGKNLNLSPLFILVSLAVWGWLWGLVGMILAIPLTVTLRIAMEHSPSLRKYAILLARA